MSFVAKVEDKTIFMYSKRFIAVLNVINKNSKISTTATNTACLILNKVLDWNTLLEMINLNQLREIKEWIMLLNNNTSQKRICIILFFVEL